MEVGRNAISAQVEEEAFEVLRPVEPIFVVNRNDKLDALENLGCASNQESLGHKQSCCS